MKNEMKDYVLTPYFSRLEALGISVSVGVVSHGITLTNLFFAAVVLAVLAFAMAAARRFWGEG